MIVVVITASGSVSKRVFEFEDGVDPGLVEWARAYLDETIVGQAAERVGDPPGVGGPGLDRERLFLETSAPRSQTSSRRATDLYVGGAAGLLGDARGAELEACQRLLEVLERRAAVLGLLQEALDPDRTVVRVGPEFEGEELRGASYVGTTYGLANRSLGVVGLLGPLRMDYEKAIRSVRAAAFELSRLVEDVYGASLMATTQDDYYALLGVPRDASHDEIKRAFRRLARELHPDVSEDPTPDSGSVPSPRHTRCCPIPSGDGRRTGRARRAPQRRIRADGRRLRQPLRRLRGVLRRGALRAGRGGPRPAAGRTSRPTSRSTSRRP